MRSISIPFIVLFLVSHYPAKMLLRSVVTEFGLTVYFSFSIFYCMANSCYDTHFLQVATLGDGVASITKKSPMSTHAEIKACILRISACLKRRALSTVLWAQRQRANLSASSWVFPAALSTVRMSGPRVVVCNRSYLHAVYATHAGSTDRLDGLIGAEAALVLLEEMKLSGNNGLRATPDIFTYTTVISGVARAEVRLRCMC